MSDHNTPNQSNGVESDRRTRRTTLGIVLENLLDEPASGLAAWARTTAGIVALLFALQLITGALLSFYYVPSAESAHATVAYVEKVTPGGSWLRALHLYGSQLLPLALVLHLAQMLWRGAYARKPFGWTACVLLLALSMANGATGYSLPWDARAFFSTRIAESIAGGIPLVGPTMRAWLVGGAEISTLTLSRFFALHALIVPALLLAVAFARLFVFREPYTNPAEAQSSLDEVSTTSQLEASPSTSSVEASPRAAPSSSVATWPRAQFARNAVAAGVIFAALALYASKFPAPLGPEAEAAPPGYLPRPGAQFLWLFQLLKFFPKTAASLVASMLPALMLSALALLPFTRKGFAPHAALKSRRRLGLAIFATVALLVTGMTTLAYLQDSRDPRVREQLARQTGKEAEFRNAPFVPKRSAAPSDANGGVQTAASSSSNSAAPAAPPPEAFSRNCAKCHGTRGEGKSINPALIGISAQPRRTASDIVAILNDPASFGLESRMPSFARKLSDEEKRAVAEWVASLK
jgi:ubiquinol-cytochrome c reductase cytochrome b subunit